MGEDTRGWGMLPRWDNRLHKYRSGSTKQKFKDLDTQIVAINTRVNFLIIVDALIKQMEPLFTEMVMKVRVSSMFMLPSQLGVYEDKMDPMDHLDSYKNLMML